MRHKILILVCFLLALVSCTREETPGGALRIEFETGALQTKSDAPDGIVAEGGGIFIDNGTPDLVILLADSSTGDIAATYPGTGVISGTPGETRMSVTFTGLTGSATYTVYAFANTQGLWTMKTGGSGGTTVNNLTDLTSATQVEGLQFWPVSADLDPFDCPAVKNERLPLSAKGTVTLTATGNGEISLAMLRCVAKVTAVFENQYGENLALSNFTCSFAHMHPETGFVMPHDSDFPVSRESAQDLSATVSSLAIPAEDDPETETREDQASISWYVFPSIGPYTCDINFTLNAEDHGYTDLPVHDDHARDISQLARNQHLTITTRIGKGKNVSFNFEVSGWDDKTETVTFN